MSHYIKLQLGINYKHNIQFSLSLSYFFNICVYGGSLLLDLPHLFSSPKQ